MKRPEEAIQKAIVQYLNLAHPKAVWFAVPNQKGTRSTAEMGILKSLGVKAGVPDLVFIVPEGELDLALYFMEVKAPKGRLSPAQKDFHQALESVGAEVVTVYSLDAAVAAFKRWRLPGRAF